ncbi:MAG: BREX-1 system adenine-specific DNA-methyltransferase PglX [Acidobacteriota bacterium]|nr:BREX-1 system adenine-specific DNA-methyltransferase PglX [Acidobacteriota bacterium]
MPTLSRGLRKSLEKVCVRARTVAEDAAGKALQSLAVGESEPHRSMTDDQKSLRNRLRAHGRQLGDKRNVVKGTQQLERLITECAYEQWHRMLFARFLSETQLLIEPVSGEAMSLSEVKELANERGQDWVALAGGFAVRMLPQVFRQGDPVLEVQFFPEDRKELDSLMLSLPLDVFIASDSLGWCYQFWQTEQKEIVNKSGNKIGAEELPAVTQLFTEDYMVDFLVDNTLGAWHAGRVLAANPKLSETAVTEDELRQEVSLVGCRWTYLRFVKGEDGMWAPAAGTFDGWPKMANGITCLDPCMGSGHFVVAMFDRLVALRIAEENLSETDAIAGVIRDNLFGLELDARCTQIGAFNLALSAWRRVGYCALPAMNLACSGAAPNTREAEWVAVAGDNARLRRGMEALYRLFQNAPVLGSLINPSAGEGDLLIAAFHELQPLLEKALAREAADDTSHEMAVTARGLAKAAEILAGQFTLVATNVPYLGRATQDEVLKDFCERVYPEAKSDLATCFVDRSMFFCRAGGSVALVVPQNWLFLGRYKALRKKLLIQASWLSVSRLGPRAFDTISGEVVKAALIQLTCSTPRPSQRFFGLDVSEVQTALAKAESLREDHLMLARQDDQVRNLDARIAFGIEVGMSQLDVVAASYHGQGSRDSSRFMLCWWELPRIAHGWVPLQTTVAASVPFGGAHYCLLWEDGRGKLAANIRAYAAEGSVSPDWNAGLQCWGKPGVLISQTGALAATAYLHHAFDSNSAVIQPSNVGNLPALWAFCSSLEFSEEVRKVDQQLKVTNATLVKVPFDLARWQKVAAEKYPHGLPKPISSDPTQWLFSGHPSGADEPLQVAVARLLGYQWPRQTGSSFADCPALDPDGLEKLADDDGIVPISAAKGEGPAPDRLRELLARAYGNDWNTTKQADLLAQVDFLGATLDEWLRNKFFEQNCALFHNRPFIWSIWDGLPDGFHALVNYHSLAGDGAKGRQTLEKLAFSYVGDWITRQKAEQKGGKEGADGKLAAALHLQEQLKEILKGEPPHDLFVRWKPLHEQAIGWEPDINDGVRVNVRPFMMAKTLNGKSIFRKAPKIKWDKDRGKEPARPKKNFPWFWGWDEETHDFAGGRVFDGNRWNDLHYSNAVKHEARADHNEKRR